MSIVVLNAGSSSLKSALFVGDLAVAKAHVDWKPNADAVLTFQQEGRAERNIPIVGTSFRAGLQSTIAAFQEAGLYSEEHPIQAIGHRVVHGGTAFRESVRIDDQVKNTIIKVSELAPLHNPPALETIAASESIFPGVPQVAAFDTAFHSSLQHNAFLYPVPYQWYEDWGVRRFGFHGISLQYCTMRAAQLLDVREDSICLIVCHLGNGCSATAVQNGKSMATTMGFTPLDGLMMGTRCGSIDPGLLLYLQRKKGISTEQMDHILNKESGLLGISGVSSDMRSVQDAAELGGKRAQLAMDMFASSVRSAIGSLAVQLDRIHALVFTAGIGEHSAAIREMICSGLQCLGISLDSERNAGAGSGDDIAAKGSTARILVIQTDEEWMIANETRRVLAL